MRLSESIKKATLATILTTSLLIPSCGKNSPEDLQESWEKSAKVENKQPIMEMKKESQWLEARYVIEKSNFKKTLEKYANKVYFFVPGKIILPESGGKILPYMGKINSDSGEDRISISLFSKSQIDEKTNTYVSLAIVDKNIRLTPNINTEDKIGDFTIRIKYPSQKKRWNFEIEGDREFKEVYDLLKLRGKCVNYSNLEKEVGTEGEVIESEWEKEKFTKKYKKKFESEYDCFYLEILDYEKRNEIKKIFEDIGENAVKKLFESREVLKLFSITPLPIDKSEAGPYMGYLSPKEWKDFEFCNRQRINEGGIIASKEEIINGIEKFGETKEIATIDKER